MIAVGKQWPDERQTHQPGEWLKPGYTAHEQDIGIQFAVNTPLCILYVKLGECLVRVYAKTAQFDLPAANIEPADGLCCRAGQLLIVRTVAPATGTGAVVVNRYGEEGVHEGSGFCRWYL
ncbi:hypothetical protein A8C75_10730 [Marinobacterium aestuarii]|uniref:Uncharacterized protein n=1 Tax=Marinobacterium aestuarii TaxID=1821621 RepID=A0A1A9EZJ1_9GAMM|nr:hypothetical protein A8C75_10730 [Marinobacterium aestuarii]